MNLSTIFHFFKPQDTDLADLGTWISTNAATTETALKNGIALQTNTSTTAYLSDFPLAAYADGHSFVFIPLYTCTGAVTINFNSLGIKKIFLENGTTQISSGASLQKGIQYLLTYSSSIDGGIGAFKSLRLSPLGLVQPFTATQAYAADGTTRILQVSAPLDCQYYELEIGCHLGLCRLKYYTYPTSRMFTSSFISGEGSQTTEQISFSESGICYVRLDAGISGNVYITFTITKNTDGFQLSYVQTGATSGLGSGTINVLGTARKE